MDNRRFRRLSALATVSVVGVVLAACGDDSDEASPTTEVEITTAGTDIPSTAPSVPESVPETEDTVADSTPADTEPAVSTTTEVTTTTTTTTTTTVVPGVVIDIEVVDGRVVGDAQRVNVPLGEQVTVAVVADVDDEVHVHGYDIYGDVTPTESAQIVFAADIPGVFEVELESVGLELVRLQVS